MANDLDEKLENFKKMLSDEKMADNLKMLINMLAGNQQDDSRQRSEPPVKPQAIEPPPMAPRETPVANFSNQRFSIDAEKMETIMRIKQIYDKISSEDDPGVNLLQALKPYLSDQRKSRLDSAIKMVGFTKLPNIIQELNRESGSMQKTRTGI